MTDLHYQTKHDTPAIRAAAFELNIEPTPWLKPAPWWRDGWKVHKGKLNKRSEITSPGAASTASPTTSPDHWSSSSHPKMPPTGMR